MSNSVSPTSTLEELNITSDNIAEGVSILGVTGTYSGNTGVDSGKWVVIPNSTSGDYVRYTILNNESSYKLNVDSICINTSLGLIVIRMYVTFSGAAISSGLLKTSQCNTLRLWNVLLADNFGLNFNFKIQSQPYESVYGFAFGTVKTSEVDLPSANFECIDLSIDQYFYWQTAKTNTYGSNLWATCIVPFKEGTKFSLKE